MFAALLDTCVLWPSLQRDFLLSLAVENLYRPLWSSAILAELELHEADKLAKTHPRSTAEARAYRLIDEMNRAFDDAEVMNWEPYEGTFGLPDPDDEHVLAATVAGNAGALVTDNLKDFPVDKVPPGVDVLNAREFAANTVAVDPERAVVALSKICVRRRSPTLTLDDLLKILHDRYKMTEAVDLLVDAL